MSAAPLIAAIGERRLRADARRNRQRVLDAARAAFAESGVDVGMTDIAQRAGVGVGTLYRHFETKEALMDALLLDHLERVRQVAEAGLQEPDPWSAFAGVLRLLVERKVEDKCLCEVFEGRVTVGPEVLELERRIYESIRALMRRAQDAGVLRADLAPGDLALVLSGIGAARWLRGERGADLSERYLTMILDGLRAPGATPLPHRPLSKRELGELFASVARAEPPPP